MMIEAALVILECEVPNLREGVHTGGHVANLNHVQIVLVFIESFSLSINHCLIAFKVMPLSRKYIAFCLIALLYLHLVFFWTLPTFF